jgi:hypothetical protein
MGIKISVGVSDQSGDRDRLERSRQTPSAHGFRDEKRPSRAWAWPSPPAPSSEAPLVGPDWAW